MKIRLILQAPHWGHQLRVKPQLPGRYYVELCDASGGSYKPSIHTGTFASLDTIVEHAEGIHLQLVEMRSRLDDATAAIAILEAVAFPPTTNPPTAHAS